MKRTTLGFTAEVAIEHALYNYAGRGDSTSRRGVIPSLGSGTCKCTGVPPVCHLINNNCVFGFSPQCINLGNSCGCRCLPHM